MSVTPEKPVPVTFLITDLDVGGAEKALVELVTRLDRSRWSPRVICLGQEGALVPVLQQQNIPVECLGARSSWQLLTVFRKLNQLLKQNKPQILCCYLFHANILGRYAARRQQIPVMLSGLRVAEKRSRWRLWLDRKTEHLVTRHLCVSQAVADFSIHQGGLSPEKISVLPNGVDAEKFQKARPFDWRTLGIPENSKVLLAVGRLDHQKGCLELLRAFSESNFDNATLVFVGEGPLRQELERKIPPLPHHPNGTSRVLLLGHREDVPELMRGADGLILASRWEGAPNVLLEALAASLPIVATDVEGVREILREGKLGTIVPTGEVDALKQAIQRLLEIPEQSPDKRNLTYPITVNDLTWNSTVSKWEELVSHCLNRESK